MGFLKQKTAGERVKQLLAAGQSQEAISLCRDICQSPTVSSQDWLLYGSLSADNGDLSTARTAFTRAIELDAVLAEAHFRLGKVLSSVGEYAAALERLQAAAQLQPAKPDIWLALGITYGVTQQMIKAEECCRQSLELQPKSASANFNLANALQGQGKLAEAEIEYEVALKLEPGMVAGWFMLAQARVGMRKFTEAKVAATRALTLAPHVGESHYTLGSIAEALGDKEQALDSYRQAVKYLPRLPDAHMHLGQVLHSLGYYMDAITSFQNVVKLKPASVEAQFLMGQCFNETGRFDEAISCYQRVVDLNLDHLQAHYSIALICSKLGRHEEAADHFAEVLRINPRDDQARHMVAAHRGQTTSTAPAAYVSTLFDGIADTFDDKLVGELGYRTPELLHDRVNRFVTPAAASLDVIDLGCGTGLCAPLFRDMARTLHGVDLSPRMIEKARERALYDSLEVNDVATSLESSVAKWDLVISSDVFVYVGDLRQIFMACTAALRPGGVFAFSVEAGDDVEAFVLRSTGRYAHASIYIRELAAQLSLREIECQSAVLRKDNGQDINGYVFLLQRLTDLT